MNELLPSIADGYFPIFISMFLLVRIEGKLAALEKSIRELVQVIGIALKK